jgi:ribulose-phosphate 3-epimerase
MNQDLRNSDKIIDICNSIIADIPKYLEQGQIIIIGVDGPTAAGKTIFADHLANLLRNHTNHQSFVYRLDWTLNSRANRLADLAVLKREGLPFPLEAELHMRLGELECFLKKIQIYNDKLKIKTYASEMFEEKLTQLYSREDSGKLTGVCDVSIPPGSLVIVEGHYSLRSELHKYFDLNVLLLCDKKTLLDRKIARVSGYRGAEEAESYFHTIDVPSFEHHLRRFGQNATHIIQNDDFMNPFMVLPNAIGEWCSQSIDGEKKPDRSHQNSNNELSKILDNFFSASILVPKNYRLICNTALSYLDALDSTVSQKTRLSVEEQSNGLTQAIQSYIDNLNEVCSKSGVSQNIELKFTNSLHNVYFRIFPISFAVGLKNDASFAILVNIYEEKIEACVAWRGGHTNLSCKRSLDFSESSQSLGWSVSSRPEVNIDESLNASKITLLTPTNFTTPPFLQEEEFDLKITGKEQSNISSSECFEFLAKGNLCWVARLSLQSEVEFFSNLCLLVGAQTVVIGNYLIALKSSNRNICRRFKEFSKAWCSWIQFEDNELRDVASYDELVLRERDEIALIIGNDKFIKVLDTHIFLKGSLEEEENLNDFLETLRSLLRSKNRLLRKRVVQFIERQFGIIELPINKIWESFEGHKSTISITDLTLMQPTIMAELYLWMSIRNLPSAILGANVYDISRNSLDAYGHLKAAINQNAPVILQASLNALGPVYKGSQAGYLQAKNGAEDLINTIQTSMRFLYSKGGYSHPLYGIGLDHVDSRNDTPPGRARKFLVESVATGLITHIVLDGSSLFSAKDASRKSLESAYDMVTEYASSLVEGMESIVLIDKEICGGELNYIGASKLANIPDSLEIKLFVDRLKVHFREKNLRSFLRRPMLFIGNVGTTHHSGDVGEVRSEVSGEWVDLVKKDLFVSAVLHGTTETKPEVLKRSLAGCKKVNIAGDFLKTYIGALPLGLQRSIASYEPKEPKLALAKVREEIDGLSKSERDNVLESVYEHSRAVMQTINSPSLSDIDKNFFRHSPYVFSDLEVDEIINQIRSRVSAYKPSDNESAVVGNNRLTSFCASLIEVPYGREFIEIAKQFISKGVNNFHIDVGDGKLITRKFSGLAKLKKLQEISKDIITSTHLMVRDPHLTSEEDLDQSYIKSYAINGCSRIGIQLRSVSDYDAAIKCFQEIRMYGSEPGIVIEVDEPFSSAMGELIVENNIGWLVVMGVRIGFGGQIFNTEVLQKISAIRQFSKKRMINICIEVDGGLTMSNIGACRQAGADLFAGWSIVKPDQSMTLLDKLDILERRL